MSDRIARSVAFTAEVDAALATLAETEGTSRADLVRQGITMLLTSRGIDLDATAGITTNHIAIAHQRNRRHAPPGDAVREAWQAWWADHRAEVIARGHDPNTADAIATHLEQSIDRTGRVYQRPAEALVPGGSRADFRAAAVIDLAMVDLVELGGIAYRHRRGGRRWIQPAPWVIEE